MGIRFWPRAHLVERALARGVRDVEIGGRFPHASLEVGDDGLEIVPDGGGVLEAAPRAIAAGPNQHVVALVDRAEDVVDRAFDALGRDAVLGVVGLLLLAP